MTELEERVKELKQCLSAMNKDLDKTLKGNKTAAQRVRTLSIEFAKMAKRFRAESLSQDISK